MKLLISPRRVFSWAQFSKEAEPFSIALDGVVSGGPKFDPEKPVANFNHHEEVDRLATRSTAGQVYMGLKMGLRDIFPVKETLIHANDCDQDVSLAVWLLQNSDRLVAGSEPIINRLVWLSDVMDTCAGAYPVPLDSEMMKQMAWIYQPYVENRNAVPAMDAWAMRNVIEAVGKRITAHAVGASEEVEPYGEFEVLTPLSPGWAMVKESGAYARTAMRAAGIKGFVAVRDAGGAGWVYTVGNLTPYSKFPILKIYAALNEKEFQRNPAKLGLSDAAVRAEVERGEGWGGSNTIGGGPRTGSRLTPAQVREVINACVKLGDNS